LIIWLLPEALAVVGIRPVVAVVVVTAQVLGLRVAGLVLNQL
jgi:hypothetical protein